MDYDLHKLTCGFITIAKSKEEKTSYRYVISWHGRFAQSLFLVFFIVLIFSPPIHAQVEGQEPLGPPASPGLPLPSADSRPEAMQLPLERVFVRKIVLTGSTVFSEDELAEVTAPYANREITSEDLEELRRALTMYYIERGYVNSGAIIPEQTIEDGLISFHIVEGELTNIELEGNKWFRSSYIQNRLALGVEPPLNINPLQKRLQLFQQDKRIQRVNAELRPGLKPGESVLKVRVKEKIPVRISVVFDNYQSPSVGAENIKFRIAPQNLTGNGDILDLTMGGSEGLKPFLEARYSIPITVYDTIFALRYKRTEYEVVERPFDDLDIETKTDYYTITFGHPFHRSLNHKFSMGLIGEHIRNKTYLLGERFSFSPGAENGESNQTALRFFQEYAYRTQRQAIAARSRFTLGIDTVDATTSEDSSVPDSEFFAWLGQFQWVGIWGDLGIETLVRTDIQLADDSLLAVELISVGGRYSVRGYRESTFVRDNAIIAQFESRLPLFRNRWWADYIQLVPFVDYGRGWNEDLPTRGRKTIYSAGIGLRWGATWKISATERLMPRFEIYWGHDFKDVDDLSDEYDLQDDGIHFQFSISGI
jgi:hemolysin activation/secretion protein